jgi:hypothetical protein
MGASFQVRILEIYVHVDSCCEVNVINFVSIQLRNCVLYASCQ